MILSRPVFNSSEVLFAACELGVFDLLAEAPEPLDTDAVAGRLGTSSRGTELLLDTCVSLKLLQVQTGRGKGKCRLREAFPMPALRALFGLLRVERAFLSGNVGRSLLQKGLTLQNSSFAAVAGALRAVSGFCPSANWQRPEGTSWGAAAAVGAGSQVRRVLSAAGVCVPTLLWAQAAARCPLGTVPRSQAVGSSRHRGVRESEPQHPHGEQSFSPPQGSRPGRLPRARLGAAGQGPAARTLGLVSGSMGETHQRAVAMTDCSDVVKG